MNPVEVRIIKRERQTFGTGSMMKKTVEDFAGETIHSFQTFYPPRVEGQCISVPGNGICVIDQIITVYPESVVDKDIGNTERGQEIICVYVEVGI